MPRKITLGQPMESPPSSINNHQPGTASAGAKPHLDVSYADKNTAKALGGQVGPAKTVLDCSDQVDPELFAKWIKNAPEFVQVPRNEINAAGTTNARPRISRSSV